MMMMRRLVRAHFEIVVLGGVHVAGQADARPARQQCEQIGGVRRVDGGIARIHVGAQRNVHADDHQPVGRVRDAEELH